MHGASRVFIPSAVFDRYKRGNTKNTSATSAESEKPSFFKTVFTAPVIIYAITLIALPLLYIFFLSFQKPDNYGGVLYEFNLENYGEVLDSTYLSFLGKSALIGLATDHVLPSMAAATSATLWKQRTDLYVPI